MMPANRDTYMARPRIKMTLSRMEEIIVFMILGRL